MFVIYSNDLKRGIHKVINNTIKKYGNFNNINAHAPAAGVNGGGFQQFQSNNINTNINNMNNYAAQSNNNTNKYPIAQNNNNNSNNNTNIS